MIILTTKTSMFKNDVQPPLSYIRTGFDRCSYIESLAFRSTIPKMVDKCASRRHVVKQLGCSGFNLLNPWWARKPTGNVNDRMRPGSDRVRVGAIGAEGGQKTRARRRRLKGTKTNDCYRVKRTLKLSCGAG